MHDESNGHRGRPKHPYRKRVRLRVRRRRSLLIQWFLFLWHEIRRTAAALGMRFAVVVAITGVGLLWWFWPWYQSRIMGSGRSAQAESTPDIISVFVEDPQRTISAINIWQQHPGSILVLQGRPSSQQDNMIYLQSQGKWPVDRTGMVTMTEGCDTVGQIAALSRYLDDFPQPGTLTLVTSPAHLPRSLSISRIVLGGKGWQIKGVPVITGDNRVESFWRMARDQVRAQIFRAIGWAGTSGELCQSREEARFGERPNR